jgi:ribosomal protein S18 acetylase RimI-like enzyme
MNAELEPTQRPVQTPATCTIRAATTTDAATLADFGERIFIDTYAAFNDPMNFNLHLAATFSTARQAREIADPNFATLLAHRGESLAGFAQVRRGPAPACVTCHAPAELYRLYVDRRWHGSGIATELLADARHAASALGCATLWLKVWEHNARAIAFYAKSRFNDVGTTDFHLGRDRQTDRVLTMSLTSTPATI